MGSGTLFWNSMGSVEPMKTMLTQLLCGNIENGQVESNLWLYKILWRHAFRLSKNIYMTNFAEPFKYNERSN